MIIILTSANIINTTNDTSKCYANISNAIIKTIAATDAPRATSPSSLSGSAKLHIVPHMGIYKAPHINAIIADVNNYVINITKILLIFRWILQMVEPEILYIL